LATTGCYARATYAEAEYVPPHVEAYPSYHYDGRVVYLVNDRWYYREGPRWVYYRSEPVVLERRRVELHRAPPARVRRRVDVHRAPPAHDHYERRYERREAPPRAEGRRRHRH
jgi:hypothetical protein